MEHLLHRLYGVDAPDSDAQLQCATAMWAAN